MSENLPEQILKQLRADAAQILAHWQAERPELATARAEDLQIDLLGKQGLSRATYKLSIGDHDAVLSVDTPDPDKRNSRISLNAQFALKDAWDKAGIPIAKAIGGAFDVRVDDVAYSCSMAEFCHGYQVNSFQDMPEAGLKSLAKHLATSHKLATNFKHPDVTLPFKLRALGLPVGVVHNDLHQGNVIFDSTTHEVAGIIDFERARYRPLAYEMSEIATHFMKVDVTRKPLKFDIALTEQMKDFIVSYNEERPLNKREISSLETTLSKAVWRECLRANHLAKMEENDGKIVPNTVQQKFELRAAIARDTFAFRSELKAFVKDMQQTLGKGEGRG